MLSQSINVFFTVLIGLTNTCRRQYGSSLTGFRGIIHEAWTLIARAMHSICRRKTGKPDLGTMLLMVKAFPLYNFSLLIQGMVPIRLHIGSLNLETQRYVCVGPSLSLRL